jgi:hypothetical protein
MRKYIVLGIVAAAAALPSSAMAQTPSDWGGWQNQHSDNLASPNYPGTFGNNGKGDSQYCLDPGTTSTHCGASVQNGGTAVYSPVVFAGVLTAGGANQGCSHQDTGKSDNNNIVQLPTDGPANPCAGGDSLGAVYLGFAGSNTDPTGSQSQPSPVDPGQGIIGIGG